MYNFKGMANYKWKAFPCICCYSNQAAFLGSKENSVYNGTNAEKCCVLFQKQKLLPTGLEIANWAVLLFDCILHLDCVLFSFPSEIFVKDAAAMPREPSYLTDKKFCKTEATVRSQMVSGGFLIPNFAGEIPCFISWQKCRWTYMCINKPLVFLCKELAGRVKYVFAVFKKINFLTLNVSTRFRRVPVVFLTGSSNLCKGRSYQRRRNSETALQNTFMFISLQIPYVRFSLSHHF